MAFRQGQEPRGIEISSSPIPLTLAHRNQEFEPDLSQEAVKRSVKRTRTILGTTEQALKEKGRFSGLGGILKWSSRLQELMALSVSDLASPMCC